EGQVADLVDDDQPVAAQPGQLGTQAAAVVGLGQAGDPVGGGGEQHPVALPGGGDSEGGGQMGLAGARRSEQDDVAVLGQVRPGGQGLDRGAGAGLVVEVEVLQGLDRAEAGGADPQPGTGGVAGGDLTFQDRGQVVLVGPPGVAGVVGQPGGGLGDTRRLQRRGQVGDLLQRLGPGGGRLAAHRDSSSPASIPNALS